MAAVPKPNATGTQEVSEAVAKEILERSEKAAKDMQGKGTPEDTAGRPDNVQ